MRAVVQRVSCAKVTVDDLAVGEVENGLMILLGVQDGDEDKDTKYLVDKIVNLRIFEDENGKMNKSLIDTKGEMLVVSQFTLLGNCRKGRRPNFMEAAEPQKAEKMYEDFVSQCKEFGLKVQKGKFGAHMMVSLTNDGPVTILIDSKKTF
ncbi:D-aminoacyl-tRNA deacylase [Abyssisolibacter fermentans]|uniref:D-aminoacyl-tRNA deacylase n=1 Tax=Abyssisolibacter fermentans TaxID=1766203 RepID=UPI00082E7806|nr:D-aminoacyl-tRNA deacylase [Abyssisolibacter fermentans]